MKKEKDALTFRAGDAAAIAAVVLAALAMIVFFLFSAAKGGAVTVRVYQDGELIREMPLSTDTEFTVRGDYENRITVRGGRAAVTQSDCPGEDCVHSGWIDRPGRSIVCLPNRVEIRLEGGETADDVDAVVR